MHQQCAVLETLLAVGKLFLITNCTNVLVQFFVINVQVLSCGEWHQFLKRFLVKFSKKNLSPVVHSSSPVQ